MKQFISKTEKILILAVWLLIFPTLFIDNQLIWHSGNLRISFLDEFMLFLTDFGLFFGLLVIFSLLIASKKYRILSLYSVSLAISFEISYITKLLFQTPRPYNNIETVIIPLTQASGYSFPSLHAVVCLSLIPFLFHFFESKKLIKIFTFLAILIAYSRAYLGVHYISDILFGGLIGYVCSKLAIFIEEKYNFTSWFLAQIRDKVELRRQILHMAFGGLIIVLAKLKILNIELLLIGVFIGLITSLLFKFGLLKMLYPILAKYERPSDLTHIPGKGPIFFLIGTAIAKFIFPENIFLASVAILSVGDSLTTIIGTYFGQWKIPFSNKHLEGTLVAIIFSTFSAFFFVSLPAAFVASLVVLLVEAIWPRKFARILDDNLFIPVLSGFILTALTKV